MNNRKPIHIGNISRDEFNNYFCGEYLLDFRFTESSGLKEGDEIAIYSAIANPSDMSAGWYAMKTKDFGSTTPKKGFIKGNSAS
jgi:hypothetical protein